MTSTCRRQTLVRPCNSTQTKCLNQKLRLPRSPAGVSGDAAAIAAASTCRWPTLARPCHPPRCAQLRSWCAHQKRADLLTQRESAMKLRPQQWHRHAGGQHWPDHAQHAQCAHQTGADSLAQRESAMKLRLQQWHRRADQHWPDPAQHPECLNPKLRLTRSPSGSQRRSSTCGWRRRAGGRHWSNPAPPPPIKN